MYLQFLTPTDAFKTQTRMHNSSQLLILHPMKPLWRVISLPYSLYKNVGTQRTMRAFFISVTQTRASPMNAR